MGLIQSKIDTRSEGFAANAAQIRKLVDELKTSDDLLLESAKDHDLYRLSFKRRRSWQERMLGGAESLLTR